MKLFKRDPSLQKPRDTKLTEKMLFTSSPRASTPTSGKRHAVLGGFK